MWKVGKFRFDSDKKIDNTMVENPITSEKKGAAGPVQHRLQHPQPGQLGRDLPQARSGAVKTGAKAAPIDPIATPVLAAAGLILNVSLARSKGSWQSRLAWLANHSGAPGR